MSRYDYPVYDEKVFYAVIIEFAEGTMSEEFTEKDGTVTRFDLGEQGPHPFSSGFPTEASTKDTVRAAWAYVRSHGHGRVWVEKITQTTRREKIEAPDTTTEDDEFAVIRAARNDPRGECTCSFVRNDDGVWERPDTDEHCPVHN